MLSVSGLGKSYPSPQGHVSVLSDVSLSFSPGDAAAIMGPSGSGKSTLLYILGALEPPTTGTVTLGGVNPFSLSAKDLAAFRNKEIGFVFQDHCLLPQCSVLENVLVPTLVGAADAGADAHARRLVDHVWLSHRVTHLPGQLSGGEKQRVALARALVRRPRLLLCDEPTGNLDRASGKDIIGLLKALQKEHNVTIISATHDMKMLDASDRIVWIRDGRTERIEERSKISIAVGTIDGK